MDRVLTRQSATDGTYHYLSDALGSTTRLTDNNGATIVNYSYDPYGATKADAQADNPFQYTGRENDGTGLYYYRARYYSPAYQRFISEDPIGLTGGINVYAYVGGNPVSFVDADGMLPSLPDWLVDGAAGMGDVILLGQGQRLRNMLGIDGGIDQCSTSYAIGEVLGIGVSFATGAVGGVKAAGTKAVGMEFSHAIPARMFRLSSKSYSPRIDRWFGWAKDTIFNGNYVTTEIHALSDIYRWKFMSKAFKGSHEMYSKWKQLWIRTPNVYKGAAAGAAYGGGSTLINGECSCQ